MLEILNIIPGGIADQLGLQAGDCLLRINDLPVNDLVDYLVAETDENLRIDVERADGALWELDIDHDSDEPLGLILPHPEPQQCGNNCIFCFVHQLPRGMRRSLYVKDEDYRYSYLYGAYVTLTNLTDQDLHRILRQHLSPLYVSVHAIDQELREKLLGRSAPELIPLLKTLVNGGIVLHTQVVVCPGINDGVHLEATLDALLDLAPGVRSLAIVPVGLTGHRQGLPDLRTHSSVEAAKLVRWVEQKQRTIRPRLGTRFLFAADELYLRAGLTFPPLDDYEDLPQIENGVGLVPAFRTEAAAVLDQAGPLICPPVSLATGVSAAGEVRRFIDQLAAKCGLDLRVHVVDNRFFGGQVTVAGLLTGRDLIEQLTAVALGRVLLIPDVMLREGEDIFLDGLRVAELAERLQVEVEVVPADPWGIWDMLETLHDESITDVVDNQ